MSERFRIVASSVKRLAPEPTGRTRTIAVSAYTVVILIVVALLNAGIDAGVLLWSAASLCLGWLTRSPWLAFLPFLAGPIAVPFDYPEEWVGSDPLPLWFVVLWIALLQAVLAIIGLSVRRFYERFVAAHI